MDLQLFFRIGGIILVIFGALLQNRKVAEWSIRWGVALRGLKPEISARTIKAQRYIGYFMIVVGLAFFGLVQLII